jgi:hypothetical protein
VNARRKCLRGNRYGNDSNLQREICSTRPSINEQTRSYTVSDERIDPETLAQFLDGRLPPAERERVLQALGDSPDAYGDFLEAAAVTAALEAEKAEGGAEVPAMRAAARPPHRGRLWYAIPALLAAGLVAFIVLRRTSDVPRSGVLVLAQATHIVPAGAGPVAARLGDSWSEPQWSVSRGAADALSDRARAFRAGVRVAELEVAGQAGDSASVHRIAGSLIALLSGAQVATPVITQLSEFSQPSAGTRAALAGQIRSVLGAPANFDAGVWTETARLSLLAGDSRYTATSRAALAAVLRQLEVDAPNGPNDRLISALRAIVTAQTDPRVNKDSLKHLVNGALNGGAQ